MPKLLKETKACFFLVFYKSNQSVKNEKKLFIFSVWAVTNLVFISQALCQLTISGEIRPRSEYRHGYSTLADIDQDAAFFTDQKTRLNVDFKSKDVQVFLSLQDIRVWGDQTQLVRNDGQLTGIH